MSISKPEGSLLAKDAATAKARRNLRKVRVLLELMGEQPTPNLISALECRPDEVVFLVSDRTEPHARDTQAALEMVPELSGVRMVMAKVDPYSIAAAEGVVEAVLARYPDGEFIFNVTGGTKPMMIGMYRVACAERWRGRVRMVYVSTETETEQVIVDGECRERSLDLQIPAAVYLRAHGVAVVARPASPPASWVEVAVELARQVEADAREQRRGRTVSQMLVGIHKAAEGLNDRQLRERPISIRRNSVRSAGLELLRRCQAAGILGGLSLARGEISFTLNGSKAFSFLDGRWLEAYVAAAARRTEVFHDVLVRVPIARPQWGYNELDVMAMRGVVAVVCSCKAARIPQGTARNAPLDELEARSRALGRYCGKVFVTSRTGYSDAFVAKAAGMGIHAVRPQALTTVGEVLVEASHSKGHALNGVSAELGGLGGT